MKQTYIQVRNRTVELCKPLKTEDYVSQAVPYTSPPKWNLGHTSWFFEELILKSHARSYNVYDDHFSFLFNSYYNALGDRTPRAERGTITRPTVEEVYAYRNYVDEAMVSFLDSTEAKDHEDLVTLGLNHEQQHQELFLTDLKFTLALNPLFPVYHEDYELVAGKNSAEGWESFDGGLFEIGATGKEFCYDNELQRHTVYLRPYQLRKNLVTNGEYAEFMEDGGYETFSLWLDEGWSWVRENNVHAPLYWRKENGRWKYYTLAGLKEVDPDAILAHVSWYEASAFAQWKGLRLPTEFEWEAGSDRIPWGERWEWTNSAYLPYPGFRAMEGAAREYNGKFMVNQMVLRGASVGTSPGHSRKTYRNFFHPHFQWQFSGIRLSRELA